MESTESDYLSQGPVFDTYVLHSCVHRAIVIAEHDNIPLNVVELNKRLRLISDQVLTFGTRLVTDQVQADQQVSQP
jgi:hypothetical protein